MSAPQSFVEWMSNHKAHDKKFGRKVFHYHPRSDQHSKMLCRLVLADLLEACPLLLEHATSRKVVAGVNVRSTFAGQQSKTLDLAIGIPEGEPGPELGDLPIWQGTIGQLLLSCEAKQCMTEHLKTNPRIYDELQSSCQMVHQGDPKAIAAGIAVVNAAARYASPTRQVSGNGRLIFVEHRQPDVTAAMVKHLERLPRRAREGELGFDAFALIVIDCDNVGPCRLWTGRPAPQAGDKSHYESFLADINRAYVARFSGL